MGRTYNASSDDSQAQTESEAEVTNAEKVMLDALEELSNRDPHGSFEHKPQLCNARRDETPCDGCLARYAIRKAKEQMK